jgi:tricarballylate dehydrogenase
MPHEPTVIVVGSGNAAFCAAIAAREKGCSVLVIEKAGPDLAGGNSKYTAGAMRFVYNTKEELLPLLQDPNDVRLPDTDSVVIPPKSSAPISWDSMTAAR